MFCGNKFLAIFEDCTDEKIDLFIQRIENRVAQHNQASDSIAIEYHTGIALNRNEHLDQITRLIALANKRISRSTNVQRS